MKKKSADQVILDGMTPEERSLLLYLETRAVDYGGTVDTRRMNGAELEIAERWAKKRFIQFGRLAFACLTQNRSHWVILSELAWKVAHLERRARHARTYKKRDWITTAEKQRSRRVEKRMGIES